MVNELNGLSGSGLIKSAQFAKIFILSNVLAVPLLLTHYFIYPFNSFAVWFVHATGMRVTEGFSYSLFLYLFNVLYTFVVFIVFFGVFARPVGVRIARDISFKRAKIPVVLGCVAVTLVVMSAGNFFSDMVDRFLQTVIGVQPHIAPPLTASSHTWTAFLCAIFFTACWPALIEEFAFRGVLLNAVKPYSRPAAVAVSSLLFGIMHGNLIQMPFALTLGIAFGIIYLKTNNLWVTVACHFAVNLYAVTLDFIGGKAAEITGIVIIAAAVVGALVFASVMIATHERRKNRAAETDVYTAVNKRPRNVGLTHWQKTVLFFVSPLMIWAVAMFVMEMVENLTPT